LISKVHGALLSAGTLATAISISACGSAVTAGTQADAIRSWEVSFVLSGGIAGMTKQMTISHDGRLVAENLKRGTRAEKRISPDQLQNLDRMVGQYQPMPASATGILGRRCSDCINYRLTVTGTGERPALSENGTIEGRRPSDPDLIGFLISLLNQTVPP
jgi:hypothetical protein